MTRRHSAPRPRTGAIISRASIAMLGTLLLVLLIHSAQPTRAQSTTTLYLPLIARAGIPTLDVGSADARLPANGISTTTITATVSDARGKPQAGVPVRLSTTLGNFANQDTVIEQTTDAQGTVRTTLQSVLASNADVFTITAETQLDNQRLSDATHLRLIVPERVTVSSLPISLTADVRQQSLLVVQVQDNSGAPVPRYPISLATAQGGQFADGQAFTEATTGANGRATVPWYATPTLGTAQVSVQAGKTQGSTGVQLVPAICNDFEDNDVPNQASEQPSAACLGSFQDDDIIDPDEGEDDYYLITLDPQQQVHVDLTNIPAGADYDVILYSSRLKQVAFSNQQGQQAEQISYTHSGTTRDFYYLRLNMYRKSSTQQNSYQLRVRLNPLELPGSIPVQTMPELTDANDPPLPAK